MEFPFYICDNLTVLFFFFILVKLSVLPNIFSVLLSLLCVPKYTLCGILAIACNISVPYSMFCVPWYAYTVCINVHTERMYVHVCMHVLYSADLYAICTTCLLYMCAIVCACILYAA